MILLCCYNSNTIFNRISRPDLVIQHPLPSARNAIHDASRAFPNTPVVDQDFILTPALTLPSSFGTTYVGECFTCSLCANNELPIGTVKAITKVQLTAEIQTPSQKVALLEPPNESEESVSTLPCRATQQRTVEFDLREEGAHTLIVTVTYTESSSAAVSRIRTFKKLYQFEARPCLNIRTKATELDSGTQLLRYTLEAQIENLSESTLNIIRADLLPQQPFEAKSLNRIVDPEEGEEREVPALDPRDIYQIAFLLEQTADRIEDVAESRESMERDGRVILGQISLEWMGAMGQKGRLTTSNLMSRKR